MKLGSTRHMVHVSIDAAPAFGRVPAHADVAIVMDGSRSMAQSFSPASGAARAYLSHLPNANVHVTTFDRAVRAPFGPSIPVRDATRARPHRFANAQLAHDRVSSRGAAQWCMWRPSVRATQSSHAPTTMRGQRSRARRAGSSTTRPFRSDSRARRSARCSSTGDICISGELWSRAVSLQFSPSESEGRLWSGLVFGSSALSELSQAEMMLLATKGGAVSPVTSYLAVEPGVRPSTEGLELVESGVGDGSMGVGEGGGGIGSLGTVGHGGGSPFDPDAALSAVVAEAMRACGARATRAEVHIETTVDEIVDISAATLTPAKPKVAHCVTEKVWDARLPDGFDTDHESYVAVATAP